MKKLKVFYTASFYGKDKYQRYYDLVLKRIEENDVEVIGTEKGNYMSILPSRVKNRISKEKLLHYEAIRRGILWCDAAVIEISHEDFQLGHEATLAIQAKKPVLCLSINENFSRKINNKYFYATKYNEYSVGGNIKKFLDEVKKERFSERFNMFLSKSQLHYLDKISLNMGVNKSEYLRSLLDRDRRNESNCAKK